MLVTSLRNVAMFPCYCVREREGVESYVRGRGGRGVGCELMVMVEVMMTMMVILMTVVMISDDDDWKKVYSR